MASLADLASGSPTPARARARAREPSVFTVTWETCRRKCRTCVIAQSATWCPRQGTRWRGRTRRQNVASLAHVASGSQVASPNVTSMASGSQVAWLDVASKFGATCPRGVREPRGVAGRGVKTWRQAPSIYVASQDVASKRGVTKPGLPARVFKMCLQSSGDKCTPTGDHPVALEDLTQRAQKAQLRIPV